MKKSPSRWNVVQQTINADLAENEASGRQTSTGTPAPEATEGTTDKPALEPNIHLSNLKAKLQLIRKNGKSNFNLEAMSDLVEEARFNKSAILDDESAGKELKQLLSLPWPARRAMHLREITELGRKIEFPTGWHGTDRSRCAIRYHSLQRLRIAEFEPNQVVVREGATDTCAYWIIGGDAVFKSTATLEAQQRAAAAVARAEAEAQAAAAAQAVAAAAAATTEAPSSPAAYRSLKSFTSRRLSSIASIKLSNKSTVSAGPSAFANALPDLDTPRDNTQDAPASPGRTGIKKRSSVLLSTAPSVNSQGGKSPRSRQISMRFSRQMSGNIGHLTFQKSVGEPDDDMSLALWDMFGEEALLEQPYACNVVATSKLTCAVLQLDDYRAAMSSTQGETFESLKVIHLMLMNRSQRTSKQLQELADHLGVFSLFKNMELAARMEVCNLVEYIYCPPGFTLFEEGDRIDFCYLIMHGQVTFTKYDEKTKKLEDLGTKGTGDHFGTLMTLSAGEKKRPFTAVTVEETELAVIGRVGYNRILKKQLQGAILARVELLRGLAVMRSNSTAALQRVATMCQDELYPPGCVVVDPASPPNRLFFIMEGEAKLVWVTEQLNKLPDDQVGKSDAQGASDAPMNAAAEKAEKAAKEVAMAVAQQLGSNSFGTVPRIGLGKRRHTLELARLATGDVLNGATLVGLNPLFHVVAVSQLKLVSLETDNVENCIGRESWRMLCDLVRSQHNWAKQRLQQVVDVRQVLGKQIMDAATRRNMQDKDLRNFMDHFIPTGATDQQETIAYLADEASTFNMGNLMSKGARLQNFDDVLRLPTIVVKPDSLHGIPDNHAMVHTRPTRNLQNRFKLKRCTAGGSANLGHLSGHSSLASLTNQPSFASLQGQNSYASTGGTALTAQPSYTSSAGLNGQHSQLMLIPATNAAQLAGIGSNHHHHLGTTVGANLRKKKNRHMAFAGGVATAILDQTTEPTLTASMTVFKQRQEALQNLHRQHLIGNQSSMLSSEAFGCIEEASQPRLDAAMASHSCTHISPNNNPATHLRPVHPGQGQEQHRLSGEQAGVQGIAGDTGQQFDAGSDGGPSPPTAESSMCAHSSLAFHAGQQPLDQHAHWLLSTEQQVNEASARGPDGTTAEPAPLLPAGALSPHNMHPIVTSPMLSQKMVVRRASSPKTARFAKKREAVLVSASLNPDGSLQDMVGVTNPNLAACTRPARHTADAVQMSPHPADPSTGPASQGLVYKDPECPVMILPTMMNVYQSVLTSDKPLPSIVVHKHKSASHAPIHWAVTSRQDPGITQALPHPPPPSTSRASMRSRVRRVSSDSDDSDGVVRIIAAAREHEPPLPLDVDRTAPPLTDHELADPSLQDISYMLHRWCDQWAGRREAQLKARLAALSPEPHLHDEDEGEEELENFGAPTWQTRG